jgi:hypothetical protein
VNRPIIGEHIPRFVQMLTLEKVYSGFVREQDSIPRLGR